jgi:hypothetical protein
MTEEITRADRLRLAAVDKEVLAQARAEREHRQELARIESGKVTKIEELRSQALADRRQRIGWALAGLASVIVILAGIVAIWTAVDRDRTKDIQQEQLRQQTAQECIRAGNILTADGACLITQRDAPAPAAR